MTGVRVWVVWGRNGENDEWVDAVCSSQAIAEELIVEHETNPPTNNGPYEWWWQDFELDNGT